MAQLDAAQGGIVARLQQARLYDRAVAAADTVTPDPSGDRPPRDRVPARPSARLRQALEVALPAFCRHRCFCTEHQQHVAGFLASVLGMEAIADVLPAGDRLRPSVQIMGVFSDICALPLGERVLGLPREPRP